MALRKCPVCGAAVKPENLPRHLQSVHPRAATSEMVMEAKQAKEAAPQAPRARARSLRTMPSWRIPAAILVTFLVVAGVYFVSTRSASPYNDTTPVTQMCMEHSSLARHDHAYLTITILGAAQTIPTGIGSSPCMRPLHTHPDDPPGKIHVESPVAHEFTLRDFFTVWQESGGYPFTRDTIMGYQTDATHTIVMTVNGVTNTQYENYAFPHDTSANGEPQIAISYQSV